MLIEPASKVSAVTSATLSNVPDNVKIPALENMYGVTVCAETPL
jgi:hypothetical protein